MFAPTYDEYFQIWRQVSGKDTGVWIVVFPQLKSTFDDMVRLFGVSDADYPTEAWKICVSEDVSQQSALLAKTLRSDLARLGVASMLKHIEVAVESGAEWKPVDYAEITNYMANHIEF